MLSSTLNICLEDKIKQTLSHISMISSDYERDLLERIIFTRTSLNKVRLIPFDFNWILKKEFNVVLDAIIALSGVIIGLKNTQQAFKEDKSKQCIIDIEILYRLLKEGLREHGCKHPSYKLGTYLKHDDIISAAQLLCNLLFKQRHYTL